VAANCRLALAIVIAGLCGYLVGCSRSGFAGAYFVIVTIPSRSVRLVALNSSN